MKLHNLIYITTIFALTGCSKVDFSASTKVNQLSAPSVSVRILSAPKALDNQVNTAIDFIGSASNGAPIVKYECQVDTDFFECQPGQSITALNEGPHHFEVKAFIAENNGSSDPATHDWEVDSIAPKVNLLSSPKLITNLSSGTFTFAASDDNGSGIENILCKLEGQPFLSCMDLKRDFMSLTDGKKQFSLQAVDKAGNKSDLISYNWLIDTVPPTLAFGQNVAKIINKSDIKFPVVAKDDGSGIDVLKCVLDADATKDCTADDSFKFSEGDHKYSVVAFDKAGNKSLPLDHAFLVDSIAPKIILTEFPKNPTSSREAKFVFSASDVGGSGVAKYSCKLDAANFSDCASPQMYAALASGAHAFEVKALDFAGNESESAKWNWMIDNGLPTIKITKAPLPYDKNPSATFEFIATDGESGVAKTLCSLDNPNNYKDCTSPYSVANLSEGNHSVYIKAVDNAGNESVPAVHQWMIDTIAPVVDLVTTPKNPTTEKTAAFTYTVVESGSGLDKFYCKLDGVDYPCLVLGSVSILNLLLGDHYLSVYATDKAGNTGYAAYSWKIEDTAPKCYQDRYDQPDVEITKKIDILFITDSSGSLDQEKAGIAAGIDSFVAQLPADVDFQIGVVLAHGSKSNYSGKLFKSARGDGYVLSNKSLSINTIRQQLAYKLTSQPTDNASDGGEEGLYSLTQMLNDNNYALAQSQGFFRADSALAIVFVADENDICAIYPAGIKPVVDPDGAEVTSKASDCGNVTHETVYSKLKMRRPTQPLLVSGMIYTNPLTVPAGGENEVGYGYTDIIKLNNDTAVDLASPDYAKGLATIGSLVTKKLNLMTSFKLKYDSVDPASIVVKVDNKVVKHTYVALTNEVQISATDAGMAKSVVLIDYCQKPAIMVSSAN